MGRIAPLTDGHLAQIGGSKYPGEVNGDLTQNVSPYYYSKCRTP